MNSNTLNPAPQGFRPHQSPPAISTANTVTPKASRVAPTRVTLEAARPDLQGDLAAEIFLLEEGRESDDSSVVYVARVREPERLLRRRGMHFHGDVIEALSDLVLSLVGGDPSNDTDTSGR